MFRHPEQRRRHALVAVALLCLIWQTACNRRPDAPTQTSLPNASSSESAPPNKVLAFGDSLDQAFRRADQEGWRVLVYFQGADCAPCRRMEAETHRDPGVIEVAKQFVCVKLDASDEPELREKYAIYSIPRTIVMTSDGKPVDTAVGFVPPEEHRLWLAAALGRPPTTWREHFEALADLGLSTAQPTVAPPPPAVGAAADETDLLIWFIEQRPQAFADEHWIAHAGLLELLKSKGFRPRIEHLYRWDATDRWREAEAAKRLPDVVATFYRRGLLQTLMQADLVRDVISRRLWWQAPDADPLAACDDFQSRWIWSVNSSPHAERATEAIDVLFAPRPGVELAPDSTLTGAQRAEVEGLAADAARAWSTGDLAALEPLWDDRAPLRDASPGEEQLRWRRGSRVEMAGTRLFGNDRLAVALAEMRIEAFPGKDPTGIVSAAQRLGTPALVILRRAEPGWRVLAVGQMGDDLFVDAPANFFAALKFAAPGASSSAAPSEVPVAEIVTEKLTDARPDVVDYRWSLPASDAAEFWLVQAFLDQQPRLMLRRLTESNTDRTTLSDRVAGTVEIWTIRTDGAFGFSERKASAALRGR